MKKNLFLLIFIFSILIACTKQTPEDKIQFYLDKAEGYYNQENYEMIDAELDRALELSKIQYGEQSIEMAYIYLKAASSSSLSDAIDRIEIAETVFKKSGNVDGLAKTYYEYGRVYKRKGDSDLSKSAFEEALRYCDMNVDDVSELKYNIYLYLAGYEKSSYEKALKYCKDAEALFSKIPEQNKNGEKIMLYVNIGNCYFGLKQYNLAIENYEKVIECWNQYEEGDELLVAQTYDKCGYRYAVVGDYDKGIEYINQSLIMFEKIKEAEIWDYAIAYRHLSTIYNSNKIQDYEKALEYGIKSCQVFTEQKELNAEEMEQLKMLKDGLQELYDESPIAETQDFESWYRENIDKELQY